MALFWDPIRPRLVSLYGHSRLMKWSIPSPFRLFRKTTKVFFHVGPHKTGTTSIQHALLHMGEAIHYPFPQQSGPGHAHIARRLIGDQGVRSGGNLLIETIEGQGWKWTGKPIVFSAETFSKVASHTHAARCIYELAHHFHTELIITHRPLLGKVYSRLQEGVKHGNLDVFDGTVFSFDIFLIPINALISRKTSSTACWAWQGGSDATS